MKLSKKTLPALIGLILILGVSNVAFALLYMSRNVNIIGGVSVVGTIEVYDEDMQTPLTDITFENYTGGIYANRTKNFAIINTGNQPVFVYWNISSSSVSWTPNVQGYNEQSNAEYTFRILTSWNPSPVYWSPNDYTTPEALIINAGETKNLIMEHTYNALSSIAEVFDLTITFYAENG